MALWLTFPLVPVTTSGYVPVCAGLFTLMVRSEFPDPVIEAGLNAEVVFFVNEHRDVLFTANRDAARPFAVGVFSGNQLSFDEELAIQR